MTAQTLTSKTLREAGEVVTVTNRYDGLEIGYLLDGQVWQTTGNGGVVEATKNVFGLKSFTRDGGQAYLNRAKSL